MLFVVFWSGNHIEHLFNVVEITCNLKLATCYRLANIWCRNNFSVNDNRQRLANVVFCDECKSFRSFIGQLAGDGFVAI